MTMKISWIADLERPRIVSWSESSVTLESDDGSQRVLISIDLSAIDDRLGLTSSSAQLRREIVEANLSTIVEIAIERYAAHFYSIGERAGVKHIQIVLGAQAFSQRKLTLPERFAVDPAEEEPK